MPDLTRNAVDVLPEGRLAEQLKLGRPLRVKLGIDPTTADIHLGHTVVLTKLREFQDAGHKVVLIIGDFTARVGDPTGRAASRPVPSPSSTKRNRSFFRRGLLRFGGPGAAGARGVAGGPGGTSPPSERRRLSRETANRAGSA